MFWWARIVAILCRSLVVLLVRWEWSWLVHIAGVATANDGVGWGDDALRCWRCRMVVAVFWARDAPAARSGPAIN